MVVGVVALGVTANGGQSTSRPEWKAFDPDEKGAFKPFWQEMKTETNQSMKAQGMEVNQKQTQTFYVKWTPKTKEKNGWTVEFKIVGVKMAIQIGGNEIAYDSTSKEPAPDNPLTQFFKTLKDAEFTYTIEKDDKEDGIKVTKVAGLKPFVDRLAAANDQLKGLLENILNEEALRQMANPMFAAFPRTEKEFTDGKWMNTATMNMGPIGSYKTDYTYTLNKGDTSKIDVTGAMTYKAPEAKEASGLPFTIKEGNLKADNIGGNVVLDLKAGRIKSSMIKMDLKGTLKIDIAGVETSVDLNQTQTSSMETMDTEPAFLATTAPPAKK